jgi:hypothetical protein
MATKRKSVKKAKAARKVKAGVTHTSLFAERLALYNDNKALIKERKLPIKQPTSNYISIEHGVRMNKHYAKLIADEKRKPASEAKPRKPRARAAKAEVQASA